MAAALLLAAGEASQQNGAASGARVVAAVSEQYRARFRQFDECLISAARQISKAERDPVERYRAYERACSAERSALIAQFVRDNANSGEFKNDPEARWGLFESAIRRADERVRIWVPRFLDARAPRIEPQVVDVISAED